MIKAQIFPTVAPMWVLTVYDENGDEKHKEYCVDRSYLVGTAYSYNRIRPDLTYIIKADLPKEYDSFTKYKVIA